MKPMAPLARVILILTSGLLLQAASGQTEPSQRSDKELKQEWQTTQIELKNFQVGCEKLDAAAKQSSNARREKIIDRVQELLSAAITRREDDLGLEHTIRRHGTMVAADDADIPEVGEPIVRRKHSRTFHDGEGPNAERLARLSRLEQIYVAGERIYRQAIAKEGDAYERYVDLIEEARSIFEVEAQAVEAEIANRDKADRETLEHMRAQYHENDAEQTGQAPADTTEDQRK